MAVPLAIDVYDNNTISEALFRRSGARLLIAKRSEGDTFLDQTYDLHRAVAAACGVPFGAYLFLHANSTGNEAAFFLQNARLVHGRDMDPIIDCEVTDGLGVQAAADRAVSCADAIIADGWDPWLYSSEAFLQQLWAARPELKARRVWEAQYPGRFTSWSPSLSALRYRFRNGVTVGLWQWTDLYADAGHRYDCSAILAPLANLISRAAV